MYREHEDTLTLTGRYNFARSSLTYWYTHTDSPGWSAIDAFRAGQSRRRAAMKATCRVLADANNHGTPLRPTARGASYATSRKTYPSCRRQPDHPWKSLHSFPPADAAVRTCCIPAAPRAPCFAMQGRVLRAPPLCAPSPLMHARWRSRGPAMPNPGQFKRGSSRGRLSRTHLSHASLIEWSPALLD